MRVIKTNGEVIECSVEEYKVLTNVNPKPKYEILTNVKPKLGETIRLGRVLRKKRFTHKRWTVEDDEVLENAYKNNFNYKTNQLKIGMIKRIADALGRSRIATSVRINTLNLNKKYKR